MSKLFRFRIGPVFLIALVLSGLLLWWKHGQDQRPKGPVIVQHQTPPRSGAAGVPDPPFVAQQGGALGLSEEQAGRVRGLEKKWEQDTGDLQHRLDAAAAALQDKLQHAGSGKLTPGDYRAEAGEVQALSGELAARLLAYWPRLQGVLTPDQ